MDAHSSLSSHPRCSSHCYGLQGDPSSSKHNKRLDFPGTCNCPRLLEQPRLLPTAQAAPRQIDYTDHLQSKLTELFPGFVPSSYPITQNCQCKGPGNSSTTWVIAPAFCRIRRITWVGAKCRNDWE